MKDKLDGFGGWDDYVPHEGCMVGAVIVAFFISISVMLIGFVVLMIGCYAK